MVWDATALHRIAASGHRTSVTRVELTPSGRRFVSGANDHSLRMWDLASGHEIARIATTARCDDGVIPIGEDQIAASCDDSTIRRWDLAGHELAKLDTDVWLRDTAISRDGRTIAAAHLGGRLALIDVASWTLITEITAHGHQIYGLQFLADGRLVSASLDNHVKVWRVPSCTAGGPCGSLELDLDVVGPGQDGLLAAQMSPDGAQLESSSDDGTVAVWDVATHGWLGGDAGAHLAKFASPPHVVYAPDGAHAYGTVGADTVLVWERRRGRCRPAATCSTRTRARPCRSRSRRTARTWSWGIATARSRSGRSRRGRCACGSAASREHDGCADLATAAWVDPGQREIVTAACQLDPASYATRLAARSHQRLDEADITSRWDWEPVPAATPAPP